jgi:flagellar motor switch protein FliM
MSDTLSQEEIDALLRDLARGNSSQIDNDPDISEKKVRTYNFAKPSKFGKEQLRTLEVIFEGFSRLTSSFLTGYLRASVQIEVANAEQMTYSEFNNSLLNPVVLGIIDFKPLKGSIILDLSSQIGYAIIDRILGGSGETLKKNRDFTEIEKILLGRVINEMVGFLVQPWENVCEINPKFDKIETNAQFAQIISPNEMIALVTLSIKVGEIDGMINICIPYIVIEPIISNLNTKHWFTSNEDEDLSRFRPVVEKGLEAARVPLSVIVGKTTITVDEFINLQVGDVITLDSYVNSDFQVMVGNLLKFSAKPGLSRGKNAVQITSVIRKEE